MRLIDAEMLIERAKKSWAEYREISGDYVNASVDEALDWEIADIANSPTIKAYPVKLAYWMPLDDCMAICSSCGSLGCESPYCPICGSKMEEVEEDETD